MISFAQALELHKCKHGRADADSEPRRVVNGSRSNERCDRCARDLVALAVPPKATDFATTQTDWLEVPTDN